MAYKKDLKIAFNKKLGIWVLFVPHKFSRPFCSSCLADIDKEKPFYFCRTTQNFYCAKCMFKVDTMGRLKVKAPTFDKEDITLCIQKVEKMPEVKK